jgi:protein-tyrosine kinase
MNILTRTIAKMKKGGAVDPDSQLSLDGLKAAQDYSQLNTPRNGKDTDESALPEYDIDIRLDEDLTDFAEQSKQARHKDAELDFDLTVSGSQDLSFIETQVININTSRSFSHQTDVDLKKVADEGFITPDSVNTVLANTFRQIKRPLLNNIMGKGATVLGNANMIMFTSSLAGEGKTFSAINMAMSIALEKDKRVLLIDADVNKPSHHHIFGVKMQQGLTDMLMGRVDDLSKVIYKTNVPSLSLMFSGSRNPHATELFASKAMENFVAELSDRYEDRVIIFDSAPLLLPTEASVLASHMGQVVLVIEAEKTSLESVNKSIDSLSNSIVLMLLNKMRENGAQGAYGFSENYEEQS